MAAFKLSEIKEPLFEVELSPDNIKTYDPIKTQITVEKAMVGDATPGESATERLVNAIKLGFPDLELTGTGYLSVWGALQKFLTEIDAIKNLSGLSQSLSATASSQAK